ncbi:MAG TPA: hypothetical protein VH249_04645 [Xanthobacteraceae bacterium]|nr:hypothetical protein [Xanthobacteraceae bacterium]
MAVLAASIGLVGTGNPVKQAVDVPDVGRSLMQQAIVETPDWQHFQLLAYSRRADELLRLRDLPAAPARAVVEFAEQAQADAALAEPAADSTTRTAALQVDQAQSTPANAGAPAPLAGTIAAEPAAGGDAPLASPATEGGASVATIVASIQDGAETTAAIAPPTLSRVVLPRPNLKARAEARKKKLPAEGGQVASIAAGATASAKTAEIPSVGASRRGTKIAAQPRKKRRHVARPPRQVPPDASTGFPIDVQQTNGQGTTVNARFGAGFEGRR